MEEKQLFGAVMVNRERGAYLRRLEQLDKAREAYNEAIRCAPDGQDVRALVGRSQVCGDAVHPHQAYDDAELALSLDPKNLPAKHQRARATYTMTEFERSLVFNHRGYLLRKKPGHFREGINTSLQTIQNCVGENAGNFMLDLLPLIKQKEAERIDEEEPMGSRHVSRIPKPEDQQTLTQMEVRKNNILARVMAMKYLGAMAYDKFFIQDILADPCLKSANADGTEKLKKHLETALETLNLRQELLRSGQPYYSIKHAEKSHSKYQDKFKQASLIREREIGARTAEHYLAQITKSYKARRVKDVITQAERMQQFLDSKTHRTLPEKELYTNRLYRDVGMAYLIQHRLSYTLSDRSNRRRVAFLMGLPVRRAQSFDSVMANYPFKFIDNKQAIQKLTQRLKMCENSMMRCWLTYELARLHCSQKNFTLGKFYAKRCQKEAEEIENVAWWLNGCFVLINSDMQQGNANDVKVQVEIAHEYVKKTKDLEQVKSFLEKCADMVAETMAMDDRVAILQRQKDIIKILPAEQKTETEVLYKRISTVPKGRQFCVLPGQRARDNPSERRRLRQRGLTVIPGQEKPLPTPPRSKVLGLQVFDC